MHRTPHQVLLHPVVTEKTLNLMDKQEKEDKKGGTKNNALVFIVREDASKDQIKWAFESLFEVKVDCINVKHTRAGKQAIIKLTDDFNASDIGMRIGVF
jgi:ribosomal protein L23